VASHQLAVLSRVWLLADRLVDSLAAIHSQLAVIAARLPAAPAGDAAQLLSPQQLQLMAETCASNNKIGAFTCFLSVLRIRDVYPGSEFFHPGSASKNLSI
jgi:hypothetical protein